MTKTKTAAPPPGLIFEFETEEGLITVSTDEELGELTPAEFLLFNLYIEKSGFMPDYERAAAGGAVLVLLSRKVSMDHHTLLERVT
jgi:hypothetical protein